MVVHPLKTVVFAHSSNFFLLATGIRYQKDRNLPYLSFPNSLEDMYAFLAQQVNGFYWASAGCMHYLMPGLHLFQTRAMKPHNWTPRSSQHSTIFRLTSLSYFALESFYHYVNKEEWAVVIFFYYHVPCPFGSVSYKYGSGRFNIFLPIHSSSQSDALLHGKMLGLLLVLFVM